MTLTQYALVGALCLAALLGGGLVYRSMAAQIDAQAIQIDAQAAEIRTLNIVSNADKKAAQARQSALTKQAAKLKKDRDALELALTQNPVWAAECVPADVAAALGVSGPACN